MLSQKRKLHLTSGSAFFLQIFTMICGFILPRLFLEYYGSAVNGLIASITQFLGFISLAECGVGAVVQSALYKPLAQKNYNDLSRIIVAAEHFFRNIAKLLLLYTAILVVVYPNIINANFGYIYTVSLILIIVVSSFAQYYFGITYRLLLNSDQFGFVPIIVQIIALSLNLVASIVLMKCGFSIHVVKLASSTVFLLQPLTVSFIARRWYKIDRSIVPDRSAIPQKWNGIAQHISSVVLQSSGIVVLTIFSSLEKVSVFTVYNLVVHGIKNLTTSLTSGMQAYLGNLFAKGDMSIFKEHFESFEWKVHFVVTITFCTTAFTIVPFVSVYTKGIYDVNYIVPAFGLLITAAWGMYCIRLPYNVVVLAVGHYKQTQNSAIIEAVLNLLTASILVFKYGLAGVAVGTLAAMVYRTFYLAHYISKNIVNRSMWTFIKHLLVDLISISLVAFVIHYADPDLYCKVLENYLDWFILAIQMMIVCFCITIIVNLLFYKKNIINIFKRKH